MKTIKDLPEHSRPREKLQELGSAALTDEELVAAILGMGTKGVDVRTIARQVARLIREHKAGLTLDHLLAVPGMGLAKPSRVRRLRAPLSPQNAVKQRLLGDQAEQVLNADGALAVLLPSRRHERRPFTDLVGVRGSELPGIG